MSNNEQKAELEDTWISQSVHWSTSPYESPIYDEEEKHRPILGIV